MCLTTEENMVVKKSRSKAQDIINNLIWLLLTNEYMLIMHTSPIFQKHFHFKPFFFKPITAMKSK